MDRTTDLRFDFTKVAVSSLGAVLPQKASVAYSQPHCHCPGPGPLHLSPGPEKGLTAT